MIDHLYQDGSVGHEYEVGDKARTTRDVRFLGRISMPAGTDVTVTEIEPYSEASTYLTAVYHVKGRKGASERVMDGSLEPACEPRRVVKETEP